MASQSWSVECQHGSERIERVRWRKSCFTQMQAIEACRTHFFMGKDCTWSGVIDSDSPGEYIFEIGERK